MSSRAERRERRDMYLMTGLLAGLLLVPLGGYGGLMLFRRATRPSACHVGRMCTCKSSLRQIGLGCVMYAEDHGGKFPPDLRTLVPDYIDNPRVFSCPSNPSEWRDFLPGGWVTEASSSYVYLPGRTAEMSGDTILAYDRQENHSHAGRNVLFVDAHVEWWSAEREAEFGEKLRKQQLKIEGAEGE